VCDIVRDDYESNGRASRRGNGRKLRKRARRLEKSLRKRNQPLESRVREMARVKKDGKANDLDVTVAQT
jgi:hypothetical protein